MKHLVLVFALIGCIASTGFADMSQEDLEIYSYLYDATNSPTEKLNILQILQARKISGAGEFYARAFNSLVNQIPGIQRTASATEKVAAEDLAQILAALLGEEKYATAAPDLWRAYNAFTTPMVKAEVLISLGKLRAVEFLPQVVRALQDLNSVPPAGKDDIETKGQIIRGAVIALEKYRDVSGYLPVFFVSISGYPDRIRSLARDTLPVILEDPSELLIEQVIKSSSYAIPVKLVALQTIEAANVPTTSKAAAAVASFAQGWGNPTNDPRQKLAVADLRKISINMITRYGTTDSAVYPLLKRSYEEVSDDDEKIAVIRALAALDSEDSAKQLSSYAMTILGRQTDNTRNRTDDTMIRELIPALGAVGTATSRSTLETIANTADTPAVQRLAQDMMGTQ
jgi:hypothetical protein